MFELTFPQYISEGDRFIVNGTILTADSSAEWNENEGEYNVLGNDNKWHAFPWDVEIQVETREPAYV